ncbi:MAG: hypothetical protein R3E21_02210 [Caenibius sp.]
MFSVGADEPLQNFGLLSDTTSLESQLLTSKGDALVYEVNGDTLTAYVEVGGDADAYDAGTDRAVFTLVVNTDGSWTFDLIDQLDHPATDDPETVAIETAFEDNLPIDFSGIVSAEDADGDKVTAAAGTFVVEVDDDLPVANDPGGENEDQPLVTGLVDEDDLPTGNDDAAQGDDDPGNADGDNDGTTTGGGIGSLAALFSVGADEPLQNFGLLSDTTSLESQLLTSKGDALVYEVNGDTLTAYVEVGGDADAYDAGTDRAVFTLVVNTDGSWTFDLIDQLDHPATDDPETVAIETAFEDNLPIDFSAL